MSAHKSALRLLEFLALAVIFTAFPSGILVYWGGTAVAIEGFVIAAFSFVFVIWGVAAMLTAEYARAGGSSRSWFSPAPSLSLSDLRTVVSWCPRRLLYGCLALAAVSAVLAAAVGKVSWRFDEPLSSITALGLCSGITLMCCLALPIIASAARMPGTFRAQYARARE
jgi:hypothetical protein